MILNQKPFLWLNLVTKTHVYNFQRKEAIAVLPYKQFSTIKKMSLWPNWITKINKNNCASQPASMLPNKL